LKRNLFHLCGRPALPNYDYIILFCYSYCTNSVYYLKIDNIIFLKLWKKKQKHFEIKLRLQFVTKRTSAQLKYSRISRRYTLQILCKKNDQFINSRDETHPPHLSPNAIRADLSRSRPRDANSWMQSNRTIMI